MEVPVSKEEWLLLHNLMTAHNDGGDDKARKLIWDFYNREHHISEDSYMPGYDNCPWCDNPNDMEFNL